MDRTSRTNLRLGLLGALLSFAGLAASGCRCGSAEPGRVGNAATALDAIPAGVNAVILVNTEGLRQGSLGTFVYAPWVVGQFEEWGGAPCAALPAKLTRSAAFGIRLARGAQSAREFFFAAEGPGLADVKACLDEHAKRQGLTSSFEEIAGVRGLTDGRGLHVLAAGDKVIARSFPFANTSVLAQVSKVVLGEAPALSGSTAFRELLGRLSGDVTVALSETRELFEQYGRGLEEAVAAMVPADLCASPTEITLFLAFARAQGFGQLAGLDQVLRTKFEGLEQICLADVVHQVFRTIAAVRSAGITLTGRAEVELGLMLVFGDPAPAAEVRGVMADLVQALQVLPQNLDVLERDWPVIIAALAKRVDLGTLRSALRNPALKHVTVGGEGTTFELRVRVEESDVRAAVDATQQLLTRLVAKD
jgi:hypothetical protein